MSLAAIVLHSTQSKTDPHLHMFPVAVPQSRNTAWHGFELTLGNATESHPFAVAMWHGQKQNKKIKVPSPENPEFIQESLFSSLE